MPKAKEPLLEPFLRWLRVRRILPYVREKRDCILLDIGCGPRFAFLRAVSPFVKRAIGIDAEAAELEYGNIRVLRFHLERELPFEDSSFDMVTMLAVLEHLDYPLEILKEVKRVMVPKAFLLITTPTPRAKPILEFLSYKLHMISEKEIRDHKRYYDRNTIKDLLETSGLKVRKNIHFQMGFNNFVLATN